MDLTEIFKILESKRNFRSGLGASEEEIKNLENSLDVCFPISYKIFLKKYGYASWFGDHINGIAENPLYDLKSVTLKIKNENLPDYFSPYPEKAVALRKYDGGGYYMMYSINEIEKGKIVLLENDACNNPVEEWESFEIFLKDQFC